MTATLTGACSIRVRGVVQGVGFRPFVFRLARANTLAGWVANADGGVVIHLEGAPERLEERLEAFVRDLRAQAPPAAAIAAIDVEAASPTGAREFTIRDSARGHRPTVRIAPDLPVCARCLAELRDPRDPRQGYPYINCTDCGPRYSIIEYLPYDRAGTTMRGWEMDEACAGEYHDPASRRFHAQPAACPACGPHYELVLVTRAQPLPLLPPLPDAEKREKRDEREGAGDATIVRGDAEVVRRAVALLRCGKILAVKGLGGYHLACDARDAMAVRELRCRKYRKEKPFALMVRDVNVARTLAEISSGAQALLESPARPIVLLSARVELPGVAPDNDELGIMLPYTPLHHLLFDAGAPEALVMTSANRSSEPIAYRDDEARVRLAGLADAFLVGERPIARRVEDSVARADHAGPAILRRSRGYAPGAAATLPAAGPVLALGADLKNAVTLVVEGQAFVSQHLGDLGHYDALDAFRETIRDLLAMYEVRHEDLLVVRDCHPQYRSSIHAAELAAPALHAVQHHRAHVASVLAERGAWEKRVLGLGLDGTGYGDDGTIWGGEIFAGSVAAGFARVAHLRRAPLVGGDGAARHPVQAAAGFLEHLDPIVDLTGAPFHFPERYTACRQLLRSGTRIFATTSLGRLFDAGAALVGFTRPTTFEGQAAIWLEHVARRAAPVEGYELPFDGRELDFRPFLEAVVRDRVRGRDVAAIARAFHAGLAGGLSGAAIRLAGAAGIDRIVASGGVMQNALLARDLRRLLAAAGLELWTNHAVPPNDGGISLGQAALAAFGRFDEVPLDA